MATGLTCYRIQFPKGMDANEYALKVTPAEKSLGVLVRNAVWLGKGHAPVVDLPAAARPTAGRVEAAVCWTTPVAAQPVEDAPTPEAEPEPPVAAPPPVAALERPTHLPLAAKEEPPAVDEGPMVLRFDGERRYRVRGLQKNLSHGALRVTLLASRGERVFVDSLTSTRPGSAGPS